MILREMLVDDLDQVMEIEQDLFHVPWTKEGFFTFLTSFLLSYRSLFPPRFTVSNPRCIKTSAPSWIP